MESKRHSAVCRQETLGGFQRRFATIVAERQVFPRRCAVYRQVCMRSWKPFCKIGDCFPLPMKKLIFDVCFQRTPCPTVLDRLDGVPLSFYRFGDLGQKQNNVEPWQLVSSLLTNLEVGTNLSKKPHVFEICRRKPLHVGKCFPKIGGESVDHLCSPALLLLPLKNFPPISWYSRICA